MSNRTSGQLPEDRVERAAEALRQSPVPAGPSEALLAKTIARVGAGEIQVSQAKGWWNMRVVRRSAMAAGVVLVVTAGMVMLLLGRGAPVAFADVVAQARAAKAVRCVASTEVTPPPVGTVGGGAALAPQTARCELLMVDPGWMVTTTGGVTYISNELERRALVLTVAEKRAMLVDSGSPQARANRELNFLEQLRQMPANGGRPLGEKVINGIATKGFSVQGQGSSLEVWVDEKTERPIAATMLVRQGFMPEMKVTFSDFDWEPAYDATLLSLTPPKDYVVTQVDMAAPTTEEDVVNMLRQFSQFQNGMLPDHLTVVEMSKGVAGMLVGRLHTARGNAAENEALNQELGAITQKVGRGWAFMSDSEKGTKWHYAGKGIKLGEPGKPILWYQPRGSVYYRVFDADLSIRNVPLDQAALPEGEAIQPAALPGNPAPAITVRETPATQPAK